MKIIWLAISLVFSVNAFCEVKMESVLNSVVIVKAESKYEGDSEESSQSTGTGFFCEANQVVTSYHIIDGSDNITVVTENDNEYAAKVIACDARYDIALLEIEAKGQPVQWGNSDKVKLCSDVFIAGNPGGIGMSLTTGKVGWLKRTLPSTFASEMELDVSSIPFTQISANVFPGDSGGPVFDENGKVIGMLVAFLSADSNIAGICFAIPSDLVKHTIKQLQEHGSIQRSWLGFTVKRLDHETSQTMLNNNVGYYIDYVADNSSAKSVGIKVGDVIVSVNDIKISGEVSIGYLLSNLPIGAIIPIQVLQNGVARKLSIKVDAAPDDFEFIFQDEKENQNIPYEKVSGLYFGVTNLSQSLRTVFSISTEEKGVLVSYVDKTISSDIQPGCVIKTVNQKDVVDVESFKKLIKDKNKLVLFIYNPYTKLSFYTSVRVTAAKTDSDRKKSATSKSK